MGNNLPPGVSISDSDAPWNQNYPDPSDIRVTCPEPSCGWRGTLDETDVSGADPHPPRCPDCSAEVDDV